MNDFCDVVFFFLYSLQKRKTSGLTSEDLQEHGLVLKVEVNDVPANLAIEERPNAYVLFQAETFFMNEIKKKHADKDVIRWEARFKNPSGNRVSTYYLTYSER